MIKAYKTTVSSVRKLQNSNMDICVINDKEVLVPKDLFQEKMDVIYFDDGSLIPVIEDYLPYFKLLGKIPSTMTRLLVRPIKLGKFVSHGLLIPVDVCFKDCPPIGGLQDREDVTEILNII